MTSGKKFHAIKGWPLKVIKVVDDSFPATGNIDDIAGEGLLLPDWEEATVQVGEEIFDRKVYLSVGNKHLARKVWTEVPDGGYIFVTGDLSHRHHIRGFEHLRTTLWIERFEPDPSEGKRSPLVGHLLCADNEEYVAAAEARYGDTCTHCESETRFVPERALRYCPSCEA